MEFIGIMLGLAWSFFFITIFVFFSFDLECEFLKKIFTILCVLLFLLFVYGFLENYYKISFFY